MRLGMNNLIRRALWAFTILSVSFLVFCLFNDGHPNLWLLMGFLLLIFFCVGILFGNINAQAMEPLGHIAGVASAIITSCSTFMSVILGSFIAQSYNGSVLPLLIGFAGYGLMSLMVFYVTNAKNVDHQVSV